MITKSRARASAGLQVSFGAAREPVESVPRSTGPPRAKQPPLVRPS
jgi:hypothetical protein